MNCRGCGNPKAWAVRTRYDDGRIEESCDQCGQYHASGCYVPDVYWPGPHAIEHVTDGHGNPIHFESRRHKARVFREQGIREAGDRVHGSASLPFHGHPRYRRGANPDGAHAVDWRP